MYTHVCIYICMYIHIIYKYTASPPASTHQKEVHYGIYIRYLIHYGM